MTDTLALGDSETLTVLSVTPELLDMEACYGPNGQEPPKHWHPSQDEHFEVLEGEVHVRVDGTEYVLTVGDSIDIPRGAVHQFWNSGSVPARVRWQVRPAGRTEQWFRSVDALGRNPRTGAIERPGILAFAVLLNEFPDVFRPVLPVPAVSGVLIALLAPVGRLLGYRPVL